jgi:phosphohistidine phosphatase
MDLILWRHAEAEPVATGLLDTDRALTPRGKKQAARMAVWLERVLPKEARILVSPARRAEQTAQALSRPYTISKALAPGATVAQVLRLVHWSSASGTVLLVGHQPVLGQTVAQLIGLNAGECAMKKGAVWWLRRRRRYLQAQTVVLTVQSPDFL